MSNRMLLHENTCQTVLGRGRGLQGNSKCCELYALSVGHWLHQQEVVFY